MAFVQAQDWFACSEIEDSLLTEDEWSIWPGMDFELEVRECTRYGVLWMVLSGVTFSALRRKRVKASYYDVHVPTRICKNVRN